MSGAGLGQAGRQRADRALHDQGRHPITDQAQEGADWDRACRGTACAPQNWGAMAPPPSDPNTLPSKEAALFRQVIKHYEVRCLMVWIEVHWCAMRCAFCCPAAHVGQGA